ncbi:MAG: hypothetical protein V4525_02975 [Pseudomonadota bacterium]
MRATFYQVFGVAPNAKIRQIRVAIRSMMMTATLLPLLKDEHELSATFQSPETASDLFCLAHHATVILLDSQRRAHYDQCLSKNLHKQDLNQSRYRVLLQHTGGATRRVGAPTFSDQRHLKGVDHVGLLAVGFKWPCEEYWSFARGFLIYGILIASVIIQCLWIWKSLWSHVTVDHDFSSLLVALKIGFPLLKILIFIAIILIIYKLSCRLNRPQDFTKDHTGLDASAWTMLELSNQWRQSDHIFLGDDPIHEEAAWVFKVRMSHIARAEAGMVSTSAPLKRVWAKCVDLSLWGCVCLIPVKAGLFEPLVLFKSEPLIATFLWFWFTVTTWGIIEACLLSTFHTTIGRCVAGVTVHFRATTILPKKNENQSWWANFLTALKRSWAVWWYGMGAGVFPVGIWLVAKFFDSSKKTSESNWDAHADTIVMNHPTLLVYNVIGVFFVLGILIAWALIFFAP